MHDAPHAEPEIPQHVYDNRWKILAVLCMSLMIVIIGNTALTSAIPILARDLEASTTDLQWIVDAYSLVFAGMLFTAGTIGDRFGRKGALQGGLLLFLFGTVIASFATSSTQVIGARAVMGLAAAFVMPATLSMLTNVFPAGERPRAIAVWAGIAGGGAGIGPVASGLLLEHFSWGSVFLVNVPVILIALVAGTRLLPKSSDPDQDPLDVPGALLSIVGLVALVYGIIEGPLKGWTSVDTLGVFGISLVALLAFAWRELHTEHPMLDLRYFRDRRFSVASGGMTLIFFAMFGTFFLVAQYFQLVLGYTALQAGLFQAPMALGMMTLSPKIPRVVERFGVSRVAPFGLTSMAIGLLLFSQVGVDTPIWWIYGPVVFIMGGMALTMTPMTTLIMSAVPLGKAGVGSAMNDTTRELGGALGVAVLGSVVTSTYTSSIGDAVAGLGGADRAIAESGLVGAFDVAGRLGAGGAGLVEAGKQAFVDGISVAALGGAIAVAIAAVVTARLLPRRVAAPVATEVDDLGEPSALGDELEAGLEPATA